MFIFAGAKIRISERNTKGKQKFFLLFPNESIFLRSRRRKKRGRKSDFAQDFPENRECFPMKCLSKWVVAFVA